MKHYFLHLRDFSGGLIEDEEGSRFQSLPAARDRAITSLRELMGEAIKHGHNVDIEAVIVADQHGNHVTAVPLAAALPEVIVKALKNPVEVVPVDRHAEYRRHADGCRARRKMQTIRMTRWLG